jgi:hypothetical protein
MPLRHSRGPSALKPIKHIFGKVHAVRFCALLVSALASRNTIAQLKVRASNVHVRDLRDFVWVPRSEGLLARKFWWGRLKLFGLFLIFWLPRMRSECPSGLGKAGAGGVRSLLVPNLLYGGFGYEDHDFRLCPPFAIDHRL